MRYRTVADIFSQISGIYDRFLNFATAGQIHRWQERLISLMGTEGDWLDVGTGTGEVLRKLPRNGLRIGIDPAYGMLKVAKEKCVGCFFVQALGENLPFRNSSFDRISLSLVFRHLQNKLTFLEEAHRVLKSGGKVGIIDIGKFKGTGALLFLMRTLLRPVGNLIFGKEKWDFFIHSVEESFTLDEVVDMFESKGFKVLHKERKFLGIIHIVVAVKTD